MANGKLRETLAQARQTDRWKKEAEKGGGEEGGEKERERVEKKSKPVRGKEQARERSE